MAIKIEGDTTIIGFEGEPHINGLLDRLHFDPQIAIEGRLTICLIPRDADQSKIDSLCAAVGARVAAVTNTQPTTGPKA